jgi:hypothetical protein
MPAPKREARLRADGASIRVLGSKTWTAGTKPDHDGSGGTTCENDFRANFGIETARAIHYSGAADSDPLSV